MLGIPIANVLGVPGATWLGQSLGWRSAYWLVAAHRRRDGRPPRVCRAAPARATAPAPSATS